MKVNQLELLVWCESAANEITKTLYGTIESKSQNLERNPQLETNCSQSVKKDMLILRDNIEQLDT